MKRPLRIKTIAAAIGGATVLLLGVSVGGAQAATSGPCWSPAGQTCYPSMTTSWTPWLSPSSQGPQYWTIAAGTRVDMRCWTTGATRLSTAKWFYVASQKYPYTQGYVPADAVGSQIVVGHC